MKKILFVISQLYKGGAETSLINLLNNLDYSKYEVDLLILNQEPAENAVSLIDKVTKSVNVCNAYEEYHSINLIDRIRAKLIYTPEQKFAFLFPALDFVRHKIYDWAFFVGEWCSPAFVAYHTNAKNKAAWVHSDLSKSKNFDDELYFYFYEFFDKYIFVSNNALKQSVNQYPFLSRNSEVINNVNDVKYIKRKSVENVNDFKFNKDKPILLTCANFRSEKNHIKQVKVMSELKKRGVKFKWLNIGSTADSRIVEKVKHLVKHEGLEDDFIILGSKDNPYKYMKNVDAVTVLSDYESWSMVITEAKILGIPVIATKTAGAIEQIEHNRTGILTDFDIHNIANEIEEFLINPKVSEYIRSNIEHFDNTEEIIESFNKLVYGKYTNNNDYTKGNVLYVIDDINYKGGAHSATKNQISELIKRDLTISIFSNTIPHINIRKELVGVNFLSWRNIKEDNLYNRRTIESITNKSLSKTDKINKSKLFIKIKLYKSQNVFDKFVLPALAKIFSSYDVISVMSEGSGLRKLVANTQCKRKIQWIHTDYVEWANYSDWTRQITKDDEEIYSKFDNIVLLSDVIRKKFVDKFPEFEPKTKVIKNIMPLDDIINMAKKRYLPPVHFVSVGRLSSEKAYDRLITILGNLFNEGYNFTWDIIGDGPLRSQINDLIITKGLERNVFLLGFKENPYSYIKGAQVFGLLSTYEGIPNTIYESFILGVPVIATNVGGISDQVIDGETGWLVENDENSILESIKFILEHQEEIYKIKLKLQKYEYNNNEIINQVTSLLEL